MCVRPFGARKQVIEKFAQERQSKLTTAYCDAGPAQASVEFPGLKSAV
jgi:hypothetical protein